MLEHSGELLRLLAAFSAAGIEVVPFKGPAIAWSLYKPPALREMSDLDLLVRPPDVPAAQQVLRGAGYKPYDVADPSFHRFGTETHFTRSGGFNVDLHWQLALGHFHGWFNVDALWSRLVTVLLGGNPVRTLGPNDLLFFLSVHAAKHGWQSLRDLADILRLIAAAPIDWGRVLEGADSCGGARVLLSALAVCMDVGGAQLPEAAVSRISNSRDAQMLADKAKQRLLAPAASEMSALQNVRWQWSLLESPKDKFRLIWGLAQPSPADWDAFHLPAALWPAYFVLKPFRLLAKYALPRP